MHTPFPPFRRLLRDPPAAGMNEEMIQSLVGKPARIESDTESGDVTWKWGRVRNLSDTVVQHCRSAQTVSC